MLDNEKKLLIESEEEYRHKIASKLRTEMAPIEQTAINLEKSFWTKASEVLNSNFGLWFLSSVFITGGGCAISKYAASLRSKAEYRKRGDYL